MASNIHSQDQSKIDVEPLDMNTDSQKTQNFKSHSGDPKKDSNKRYDFNYYITRFFLYNTRLTILVVLFFTVVAVGATFLLKTTGFPSPSLPIAVVQTVYPGASSETVNREITIPIEGAIKNVEGVRRYNSTSNNSVSVVVVTLEDGVNQDSVQNRLDSAVKSVTLPDSAQEPTVTKPEIGGADAIFTIFGRDNEQTYKTYTQVRRAFEQIPEIASFNPDNELVSRVSVQIDQQKLAQRGLTIDQVQAKIASFGESLPVVSNTELNGTNATISTSLKNNSLDDLRKLTFSPAPSPAGAQRPGGTNGPTSPSPATNTQGPQSVALTDFAQVVTTYEYENNNPTFYAFRDKNGNQQIVQAVSLNLKSVSGTDQNSLFRKIEEELKDVDGGSFVRPSDLIQDFDPSKSYIVESFSQNEENQKQVAEVIAGLVGAPYPQLGQYWQYIGFALGAIQLVMLVMIALVSWRAAIIAALAIPLSFLFSTLFLYLIGESLNTLTLFSLVLVTGLVVDPALVVLEAIQRKIDSGLVGGKAVLEAIRDVGMGVFLAMLTNIIVFFPFGVISGVFGAIFRYIPLTVIPAIVGSYVVPLVILAWLGGLVLRRNKNTSNDEEANLWPVARWLIGVNTTILSFSAIVRFLIIVLVATISIGTAGFMFSRGYVKAVQFAQNDDAEFALVSGTFLNRVPSTDRIETTSEVLKTVAQDSSVESIVPTGQGAFSYYIFLRPTSERPGQIKANQFAQDLNDRINSQFGRTGNQSSRRFFDLRVASAQTGGPTQNYQISIAVKTEDLEKLRQASLDVSKVLKDQACIEGTVVSLKPDCAQENKLVTEVDDGFTDKENSLFDVQLDREILLSRELASLGRGPLTAGINSIIRNRYQINRGEKVTQVTTNGETLDVVLEPGASQPETADDLKKTVEDATRQRFDDLGSVVETSPKASIQRVRGQTTGTVQARVKPEFQNNQGVTQQLTTLVQRYYADNNAQKSKDLGLEAGSIAQFGDGAGADAATAFTQLFIALILAIVASYLVLAAFFNSFLQPLSILYTIPVTFVGVFPALYFFAGGQFGFLEIIGLIILIGIVENVAIFLIDAANQKVKEDGWDPKRAIAYASGVRLRPVLMTKITTLVSLAPLAITSPFYRSLSVVIIFGLLVSGFVSLITTPILYVFFIWLSKRFMQSRWWNKLLFFPFFLVYILIWAWMDRQKKVRRRKVKVASQS